MKGANTLIMNEATLIAAVQMYLDSQFKEDLSPEVLSVKAVQNGGYKTEGCFEVVITERTVKP